MTFARAMGAERGEYLSMRPAKREKIAAINAESERVLCHQSYHEFCKGAFPILHNGMEMLDNWHIKYVCDLLQEAVFNMLAGKDKIRDIIVNIPPGSSKSLICTSFLAPWVWLHQPFFAHLGVSFDDSLAIKHCEQSRMIVRSEWYQRICGGRVKIAPGNDKKTDFANTAGGIRMARSTGQNVTGYHFDWITVDDPQNPKRALSALDRQATIDYYDQTLQSRQRQPGKCVFNIVMQRLHHEDLTAHVLEAQPERYLHVSIPADVPDECRPRYLSKFYRDGSYFPARFPVIFLEQQVRVMGIYGYAGQYQQRPAPIGGGIVKMEWFQTYDVIPDDTVHFVIDTAYTKDKRNDPSCIMSVVPHGNRLYLKSVSIVHKEYPEFKRHLVNWTREHGYTDQSKIYVEPKASGLSVVQDLKGSGLNVIADRSPTDDKLTRITGQSAKIEAGRVLLPKSAHWLADFASEVNAFPNGVHDEQIDCLEMACRRFLVSGESIWESWRV